MATVEERDDAVFARRAASFVIVGFSVQLAGAAILVGNWVEAFSPAAWLVLLLSVPSWVLLVAAGLAWGAASQVLAEHHD